MSLLEYIERLVEEKMKLDPKNPRYIELEDEIEHCKDYLMEHGE